MAYVHYHQDNGFDKKKVMLPGGTPFVLYWNWDDKGIFYPLALLGGTGGDRYDFSFKDGVDPSSVLQFRFDTAADQLTETKLEDTNLEFRRGRSGSWERAVQRKGQDFYIAAQGSSESMVGIEEAKVYDDQIRFALRMDIAGRGDSWISAHDTGKSIRMRDDSDLRGHLVAYRRGNVSDDATGGSGISAKLYPLSWAQLIDEIK
ncbi:hypothetical protein [Nocardiopsis sp. L17-MgMaSL7]|uniref:hypothetical protein n=1 Tax=Nocardiopsis sp. L17-MgMaSL7 TaxID=1938893 RepID=UPI000D718DF8|nr:hypothetical protein [Nocardiopsis sp. L17-MgMaSL7]PWV44677.1 hypothetical protein BDW27_12225 [Nocardiopsis sp. L17-MgMaSL7]